MSKGEVFDAGRTGEPALREGSRVSRFAPWDGNQYVPYFYNPALDAGATRLIFVGNRDAAEQVYLLDLERDTVTQLTGVQGTDQNWSPYIREQVTGIRPQFIAWSQPDFRHVLFWEGNTLCRVDVRMLETEALHHLRDDLVPSVIHCSPNGWVTWGYLPRELQERMRGGVSVFDLEEELTTGCGFQVFDLTTGKQVLDEEVPFWPNHVSAAPDHRQVLLCHEGSWEQQRMYLYDVATWQLAPLRQQDDGARIGHEFWIDSGTVGYHGSTAEGGFFGTIDVPSGRAMERGSPKRDAHHYGHYHMSPDRRFIVTDGEVSTDMISIAPLDSDPLAFEPVCAHGWARDRDQRYHPHPNWHGNGKHITFTSCETLPNGDVRSRVTLLELA
jgi:Tol biopolymer transport system component